MMTINHKAVYNLREFEQAIFTKQNKIREAQAELEAAKQIYIKRIADEAKVEVSQVRAFEHSIACMAKGISTHVFILEDIYNVKSHKNKCIYCGCDDFD